MRRTLFHLVLCLGLGLTFLGAGAFGEDEPDEKPKHNLGNRVAEGLGREGMWPAPTAEDWARPCLITFQRTWEDAVAIAKEENRPILVCINMDGEIASEHWAGIRYRQPEVAELYENHVCVVASVYRHTPRDYDDQGRRILCPRFGSVTCGEHIAIEPGIFEKFCDGQRIAPRHISVDLDGKEVYDVYYINDTAGVFDAIVGALDKYPEPNPTIVRSDRPIVERVASRHVADRAAVEEAYKNGDEALRKQLLDAALKNKDADPLDLLRLAVFGLDVDQSKQARNALAQTNSTKATTLISEALRVPMEPTEREALIAALKRLGGESALARWLAGVHAGLAATSKVDPTAWAAIDSGGASFEPTPTTGTLTLEVEDQARMAEERPDDPMPRLDFAEAALGLAQKAPETYAKQPRMARQIARHLYDDAARSAREALELGAAGWRVQSVLALAAYYTGDLETAYDHASLAMEELPAGDKSWASMAVVTIFAESRFKGIKEAVKAKEEWPAEWLADLHAAYAVLMRHPLGTADQVIWHYEFLVWLGAEWRARRVLEEGIGRFQASEELHKRLRDRLMRRRGPDGLEAAYEKMLEKDESALLAAFAGVASVDAAEQHRRARRWEKAMEAYARAIAFYERAAELDKVHRSGADHYIALAHAARSRVAYQLGDDDLALKEILASFEKSPKSAGSRDQMGMNPAETAQQLLARLKRREKPEMAEQLAGAMGKLDRELLAPDRGLMGDG